MNNDTRDTIETALRQIRSAIRQHARNALDLGAEPYETTAVTEEMIEAAAKSFAEASTQVETDPEMRRFYATTSGNVELEDELVALVFTATTPAAHMPTPPPHLAEAMALIIELGKDFPQN